MSVPPEQWAFSHASTGQEAAYFAVRAAYPELELGRYVHPRSGCSLLMSAIGGGSDAIVRDAFALTPPDMLDFESEDGRRAIDKAAGELQVTALSMLISAGAGLRAGRSRRPLLVSAAGGGRSRDEDEAKRAAAVRLLLAAGLDPDEADKEGFTALMAASAKGDAAACNLILDAGADPSLKTTGGEKTALFWAQNYERRSVAQVEAMEAVAGRIVAGGGRYVTPAMRREGRSLGDPLTARRAA